MMMSASHSSRSRNRNDSITRSFIDIRKKNKIPVTSSIVYNFLMCPWPGSLHRR